MLATFIFGRLAEKADESLNFLRTRARRDTDWRVQEVLAQAFDNYCSDIGYEKALPKMREWIRDPNPNVRRAVTEGLRVWTSRPYFRDYHDNAVQLLSQLKDDDSEYVRKSVGNALRDISRKHRELIRAELRQWDVSQKSVEQTYRLGRRGSDALILKVSWNGFPLTHSRPHLMVLSYKRKCDVLANKMSRELKVNQ